MSMSLWRLPQQARLIALPLLVRGGHKIRGRPPGEALTLEERLSRLRGPPNVAVNVGFAHRPTHQRREMTQVQRRNQSDRQLEYASRAQTLRVPLDQVEAEWMSSGAGPEHVATLAQHYSVFRDLLGDGYFTPVLPLRVEYAASDDEDQCSVVHAGNVIKPAEARSKPAVSFAAAPGSVWTLLCVNLEGSVGSEAPQSVLWLVRDIPAGDVAAGVTVHEYQQPLPYRGTGYHRVAFVLFRQEGPLSLSPPQEEAGQTARAFSSEQLYRDNEERLTPAGLAFFQTDWDGSVTQFFHQTLQRPEPVFEYDFPRPYIRRQRWFPKGESVVHYFDKYADPKDRNKEMLLKRLAKVHPFQGDRWEVKYPLAMGYPRGERPPTWIINEKRKEARKISKYYYIDRRPDTVWDPHV